MIECGEIFSYILYFLTFCNGCFIPWIQDLDRGCMCSMNRIFASFNSRKRCISNGVPCTLPRPAACFCLFAFASAFSWPDHDVSQCTSSIRNSYFRRNPPHPLPTLRKSLVFSKWNPTCWAYVPLDCIFAWSVDVIQRFHRLTLKGSFVEYKVFLCYKIKFSKKSLHLKACQKIEKSST